jgi:hypothetical protein
MVQAAILIGLVWKLSYFIWFDRVHRQFPIVDPFFPAFFRSIFVARCAYLLSVASAAALLVTRNLTTVRCFCVVNLASLCILSIHQFVYNDVTFMCCAWASVWCAWLSTRLWEPFDRPFPRAVLLSLVILSLIFLGAAIGKLTPGYWSGEVLHEIYFKNRDFWTYNLLRNTLSPEQLREAATWHSRIVVCSEFLCGFLWLMPARAASILAVIMLCGIALTNNILLFSVVSSLIGLALVGLHQPRSVRSLNASE